MDKNAKAKPAVKPADDVLTDEAIEKAAAIAEASDGADEADVENAVAIVEADDAVAETKAQKAKRLKKERIAKNKKDKADAKAKTKTGGEKTTGDEKPETKEPAAPRMSLETHLASDIITTRLGSDHHSLFDLIVGRWKKPSKANLLKSQADTLVAIDGLDKKSREKAINLFVSANNEKAPSVYTRMAVSMLEAEGEFTQKSLTDFYMTAGYKIGTARRQAGEMVALFPVVGIVTKEAERGSPCVRQDASTLYQAITKTPAASGKS